MIELDYLLLYATFITIVAAVLAFRLLKVKREIPAIKEVKVAPNPEVLVSKSEKVCMEIMNEQERRIKRYEKELTDSRHLIDILNETIRSHNSRWKR